MMQIIGTAEEAGYPASSWSDIYSLSFTNALTMLIASTGDSSGKYVVRRSKFQKLSDSPASSVPMFQLGMQM